MAALDRWPTDGLPPSPAGWIITSARRWAIDRLRRKCLRGARQSEAARRLALAGRRGGAGPIADDRLPLMFTGCHPALGADRPHAPAAGQSHDGGDRRGVPHAGGCHAERLVRAKGKIPEARIPDRVPAAADRPERLRAVYLVFNEGDAATSGERLIRVNSARGRSAWAGRCTTGCRAGQRSRAC